MLKNKNLIDIFNQKFNSSPTHLIIAPGRVNLIGEHTDYNEGFVLPIAIDRYITITMRPRQDRMVNVYSMDFDQSVKIDLSRLSPGKPHWSEYIKGVAWSLQSDGHILCGWDALISSEIPIGAGLSSSAAIEMASARSFTISTKIAWDPMSMALLAQKAENQWVGVNCGIMDQLACSASKKIHALFLDCRTLEMKFTPLPPGIAIVVMDTATRRGLRESRYNERRAECEQAAILLNVKSLRDIDETDFENLSSKLSGTLKKRVRHVISENKRTFQVATYLKEGNATAVGHLLNESHASLRDDYQVSSDELDLIVSIAQEQNACYGARMTGAGFGGCAIAMVIESEVQEFTEMIAKKYKQASNLETLTYVCSATDGVHTQLL